MDPVIFTFFSDSNYCNFLHDCEDTLGDIHEFVQETASLSVAIPLNTIHEHPDLLELAISNGGETDSKNV